MALRFGFGAVAFLALVSACSSTSSTPSDDAGTSADTSTTADGSTGDASTGPVRACPTASYKTVVVVGDSISDVGSGETLTEQQPFYRTLLVQNDDTRYPEWKGFDLATCWKIDPATAVVKASKGGAIATEKRDGGRSILVDQVKGLPASLPGPVLVVGSIGGNDVLSGLANVLFGDTAKAQADIDAYVAGFGAAMADLTKAGRFGEGVKVDVLMTNIFDPSDGTGNFNFTPENRKCAGSFSLWPAGEPTEPVLKQWNAAMTTEAAKYPGVKLLDLKALYKGHDVNQVAEKNWFYKDCIHPNTPGHAAIRGLFWEGIGTLR